MCCGCTLSNLSYMSNVFGLCMWWLSFMSVEDITITSMLIISWNSILLCYFLGMLNKSMCY